MVISSVKAGAIRQYAAVIIVNLSIFNAGLGLSWSSPVLLKLSDVENPVLSRPLTEAETSWIVAVPFLVCILGSILASTVIELVGRKRCVLLGTIPRITCYLLLTFTTDIWMIILARCLNGLADGMSFYTVPIYATEIASVKIRGSLGIVLQVTCVCGVVVMLCIGPFLDYFVLNSVVLAIVVMNSGIKLFVPDSPYFLYKMGKKDEALKVLTVFRGSTTRAQEELKQYEASSLEVEDKTSLKDILKSRTVWKSMGIVAVIGFGAAWSGFNAVQFYLQTILEDTMSSLRSEYASVIIALAQLGSCLFTVFCIDKFGRKPIFTVTLLGMMVGLIALGAYFFVLDSGEGFDGFMNYVPLISLILSTCCYSAGPGSILWLSFSELFDGRARSTGMLVGVVISTTCNFLSTYFMATLLRSIGPVWTYWLFAANCLMLCVFVIVVVPETKGRSIDEIQLALGKKR